MRRSLFLLVTEVTVGEGDEAYQGYAIGSQHLPVATCTPPLATHNVKAIIQYVPKTDKEDRFLRRQSEFLGDSYMQLILDSGFGVIDERIGKAVMDVEYEVPDSDPVEKARTTVEAWEQAGFPGQGTHQYHKRQKIAGRENE